MLVVALALVGGTGCITTAIVQNVQTRNRLHEIEEARQRRIAQLTPMADAGDAAAASALVPELLSAPEPAQLDQAGLFRLLSMAAGKGDARAQALLGDILVSGRIPGLDYRKTPVAPAFQDRERGLQMLRRAASQGCVFEPSSRTWLGVIQPAAILSSELQRGSAGDRALDEALVWRARSVLHCGEPRAQFLYWQITAKNAAPQTQVQALALLLLTQDSANIAKAEAAMPAEAVGAAHREAERLRGAVAQSEQQYPAPRRKEMQ
jgi:hypothetical protein